MFSVVVVVVFFFFWADHTCVYVSQAGNAIRINSDRRENGKKNVEVKKKGKCCEPTRRDNTARVYQCFLDQINDKCVSLTLA
eukprot:gene7840-5471_t